MSRVLCNFNRFIILKQLQENADQFQNADQGKRPIRGN